MNSSRLGQKRDSSEPGKLYRKEIQYFICCGEVRKKWYKVWLVTTLKKMFCSDGLYQLCVYVNANASLLVSPEAEDNWYTNSVIGIV